MKDQKAPEGRLCEYCNHKDATLMCQGCPKTNQLCATCRDIHDKIPSCEGHSFVPLSQVDPSPNPVNIREQLRHILDKAQCCDKHDSELLTFYCEEDDTVACRDCILETHSKHDFKKIGDVVKVQRELIQAKFKCLTTEKLTRFEKAEKVIMETEDEVTENQTKVLRLVDSQKLAMTKEINKNSKTFKREIKDYYQQVEKDVRQQTDAYLTSVKQHLETYETKIQSDYTEMKRFINDKSREITTEVKALTSTQMKTLEAKKDKQEMNKISIQSIRDFAQQLTDTGSDIEVMAHSKKLQTRIQELETVEPVFDTMITDITFTPGKTEMDLVLQLPKSPEPQLSIETGSITAKTYRGPLDSYFGSLKQKRANYPAVKEFMKVTWLDKPERNVCFNVRGWLRDIQCTDDGCILAVHDDFSCGKTGSVFSSTGQCNREISRVVKARIPIPMCSGVLLRCAYHHGINAIIVSDYWAHCVYAVTPQGVVIFQYGTRGQSGGGDGQLWNPGAVCVDTFGHIFIADRDNDRVVVLGLEGRFLGNILTKSDNIELPISVAVNSNWELVVGTAGGEISAYKYIAQK
ncbi:tripartite motif-containing protein 2-like [Lingula anatina]|uniref:Tripartite motif-containing protein 2-like n=1 Tax=Lingula anatina TaxID=7574 RepID=A0A2R2MK73_LINAN|nr:tripartite motif-containing protein 2-like [Lingula anatina]|eukprot:XP_023930595.1 tripartite motif-containing protein 2-like [Lingula anatina]